MSPEKLFLEAESLRRRSRFHRALNYYRQAREGFRRVKDQMGLLYCLIALGDTYRMIGRYKRAEKNYGRAEELAESLGKEELYYEASVGRALALRGMGYWQEAIDIIDRALKYYRNKEDLEAQAFLLWAEAVALRYGGKIKRALELLKKALSINEGRGDLRGMGYCFTALGGASRVGGDFENSLKYYKRAEEIFRDIRDTFGLAYSYCGIGNALRMFGRYDEALRYFNSAMKLYQRIGDIVSSSYTLWSIAQTELMKENLNLCNCYLKEANARFSKTGDHRGRVYCWLTRSQLLYVRGSVERAKVLLHKAQEITERFSFTLEGCHAEMISSLYKKEVSTECYSKLGVMLKVENIPFNIP